MECIYRPKIHFTPEKNWMNDPNGLVYDETTCIYHLFFQYCDSLIEDQSKKFWGHAISKDLCHWEEIAPAIWPDGLGGAWSGSTVIDEKNTSGFFDDSVPAGSRMVAFYTSAFGDITLGYQKQSIAYSKNNGKTWIKYEGNPVIYETQQEGVVFSNRDPKVFWYPDKSRKHGGLWIMVIAGMWARIFTSENLREWTFQGDIMLPDGVRHLESECPDLFPMYVDNNPKNVKWVYTGGGRSYVIGELVREADGRYMFKPETDYIAPLVGCDDMYAAQSFYNDPKGRRVGIYWMIDKTADQLIEDNKVWDGYQSIPLEYKLKSKNNSLKLYLTPVGEIADMRSDAVIDIVNNIVNEKDLLTVYNDDANFPVDMEVELDVTDCNEFSIYLWQNEEKRTVLKYNKKNGKIILDRSDSGKIKSGTYEMALQPTEEGIIKLRILLDASIVDVFANDGEVMFNAIVFPENKGGNINIEATDGIVKINNLKIYRLK